MAEPCRIMLKQVAYNVFIGPLAVPILFEPQHGLLKTGFSRRTPPNDVYGKFEFDLGSGKMAKPEWGRRWCSVSECAEVSGWVKRPEAF